MTLAERLRKLNADGLIVTVDGGMVGPIPWPELCAVMEAVAIHTEAGSPTFENELDALARRMDEEGL